MEEMTEEHEELTFEQAMKKLEALVVQLEADNVGLDEALRCYEDGLSLARQCLERLDQAELRVRSLSLDPPEIRA